MTFRLRLIVLFVSTLILSGSLLARSSSTTPTKAKSSGHVTESARAQKRIARLRHQRAAKKHTVARSATAKAAATKASSTKASAKAATVKTASLHRRRPRHRWVETFTGNSYADDTTDGDIVEIGRAHV